MIRKFLPAIALLAAFVWISLQFVHEPLKTRRSDYRSNVLKQVMTTEGNVTRTDYIDDEGKLRIAANVGYATKLVIHQNNSETETFFDDRGERISLYCGYYGILREYDAMGNNIRITYLDEKNVPIVMALKYAIEERVFNEYGQIVYCRYFDAEGKPVLSSDCGFGVQYEYDDKGRRVKITYLDKNGEPMILPPGYCTLVREYIEPDDLQNGKARKEFYYVPDGAPAVLDLGQSGEYTEYDENGRISLRSYLGADGLPTVTNKGYTSVKYSYYSNDSVQSTMYYDINGKPFRMSEGQYGIKKEDGRTVFLNEDGTEQFNIKNFVYNHSEFVIIIAIGLVVLSALTERKMNWLMLILYIGVIIYFTLMYREAGESTIGMIRSYCGFFVSAEARAGILKNIWLFVPLGAILFRICPRKAILLVPFLLSFIIEAVQYFAGTGFCELSDVISNGLGGTVGYGMNCFIQGVRKEFNRKNHSEFIETKQVEEDAE